MGSGLMSGYVAAKVRAKIRINCGAFAKLIASAFESCHKFIDVQC